MIVRSADGTLIFCESFRTAKARGALLVVHGIGEHSGRYEELVEHALRLRLNVHLFDLRGHGRSQGVRGHFKSLADHHADMDAWISHLVDSGELNAGLPCFLLGHSLGGLIALTFLARYLQKPSYPEITGLLLSSPLLGLRWNPLRLLEAQVARHLPSFLLSLQVPTGISAKQLTHDRLEQKRYEEDPLVHGWITPAAFLAIEDGLTSVNRLLPQLRSPILLLLGGQDEVVDNNESLQLRKKVADPRLVEVKVFHRFFHEPLHESKKERAHLEIKKWILKCLQAPKKGSSKSFAKEAIGKETSH